MRVQHLYEDDRVEVFEGTPVAVRARLLLRYRPLLPHSMPLDDLGAVLDTLASMQILMVTVVHGGT